MLHKKKESFTEEIGSPGDKVDSCPKESIPHSLDFVCSQYKEKRKGLYAEERVAAYMIRSWILLIGW